MAACYKAYPEYKESGIKWLKVIPKTWRVNTVKRLTDFQVGWTPSTGNNGNFIGENLWANISDLKGRYLDDTAKKISDVAAQTASMKITPKGSLLYSFKLSVGSVSFTNKDMYTNEAIASFLSTSKLPLSYLYYALPIFVIENASTNIYGAKILNQELIRNATLIEPTYSEAEKIANFLDYEISKIDTLIAKQEKLIELLKEKRQAIISHAVAKGLNLDAPMKDSGVEWLGEVPEHWEITPLKYLCSFLGGGTPTKDNLSYWTDGTVPWVSPKDMKSERITFSSDYITEKAVFESSTNFVEAGALLMVVRSGILQRTIPVAINDVTVTLNQDMKALKFEHKMKVDFAFYFVIGNEGALLLEWSKEGATVESIEYEYLANSLLPVPPMAEQLSIIKYLSIEIEKFSQLETKARLAIELLKERKAALTLAAVTGKIDLRDWEV